MSAQPAGQANVGLHEVIHLAGEAAVVVPAAEYRRLRALEQIASPQEREDAETAAAVIAALDALARDPHPAGSFRWGDMVRLHAGSTASCTWLRVT